MPYCYYSLTQNTTASLWNLQLGFCSRHVASTQHCYYSTPQIPFPTVLLRSTRMYVLLSTHIYLMCTLLFLSPDKQAPIDAFQNVYSYTRPKYSFLIRMHVLVHIVPLRADTTKHQVCCAFTGSAFRMPLFEDLHRVTAPSGVFHGTPPTSMIVMLQHLRQHNSMRFTEDGRPESATVTGLFERRFRENFSLSAEQYDCIVGVFDRAPIDDIPTAIGASIPAPLPGTRPRYMVRAFSPDKTTCCGRALRVRSIWATVYTKDECYPAWNFVKSCRSGCRRRYMFDREVVPGTYFGAPCSWHAFNPWPVGPLPPFTSTKSGHAIFSTHFLEHVTIEQCTTR